MRLQSPRLLLTIAIVAAIGAAAFWPETMVVDVVTATEGPMQVTIDEEGETRVRERFVISAPVAGASPASSSNQATRCGAQPSWCG